MANKEHVERFKMGVNAWNKWVKEENPRIDLQGHSFAPLSKSMVGFLFPRADLRRCDFSGCDLTGCSFEGARLKGSNFASRRLTKCDMTESDLRGANLRNATFSECDLIGTDFRDSEVDTNTRFNRCTVEFPIFNEPTLHYLDENYGGLSTGNRMRCKIISPAGELRMNFNGFAQTIYALSLSCFLLPYVAFFAYLGFLIFQNEQSSVQLPVWECVVRLALNESSVSWRAGYDPGPLECLSLAFIVLYMLLRGLMFWKTTRLEKEIEIHKLPSSFELSDKVWKAAPINWNSLHTATRWCFYINLLAVALHTYSKGILPVPLP